jgi:carbon monoxide dehydrogenase subunit G
MRLSLSIDVPASLNEVWEEVSDLASNTNWMTEAERIEFRGSENRGTGARLAVATRLGPLRTEDEIEVTEWEEGRRIGIRHHGKVRGAGSFRLDPIAGATRFTWTEELWFPWRWGGPLIALAAKPVLAAIWRQNLARLATLLTSR